MDATHTRKGNRSSGKCKRNKIVRLFFFSPANVSVFHQVENKKRSSAIERAVSLIIDITAEIRPPNLYLLHKNYAHLKRQCTGALCSDLSFFCEDDFHRQAGGEIVFRAYPLKNVRDGYVFICVQSFHKKCKKSICKIIYFINFVFSFLLIIFN